LDIRFINTYRDFPVVSDFLRGAPQSRRENSSLHVEYWKI